MKISKAAKARIRLMKQSEKKHVIKCAADLAMAECISYDRAQAIIRWAEK